MCDYVWICVHELTIDCCGISDLAFTLEQAPRQHSENATNEVVNIPNDVENEQYN